MNTKMLLGIGVLVIAVVAVVAVSKKSDVKTPSTVVTTPSPGAISPAIVAVLRKKLLVLEELAKNDVLIREGAAKTREHRTLVKEDFAKLDAQWSSATAGDTFITKFLTNTVAKRLIEFQNANPGFTEIFVTDAVGLNIGQTNKTSDYYQADEGWWTGAYNDGKGASNWGEIEFDESSKTEAIALYVPMKDTDGTVVGIIKAVLSIASISGQL